MTNQRYLKEDLIHLRNSLGLTQLEMANQLDLALRSYQAIEAGESAYRYIHRLAAERVALILAVDKKTPSFAPDAVRRDAIKLVELGQLQGHQAFHTSEKTDSSAAASKKDSQFKSAYGVVGELVLIFSALDHQLNHVLMQILHLSESPMLEPVIASLDMSRKVEMLKGRSKHVAQQNWRKPIMAYLDKLEVVSRVRNLACHTPLIPDDKHGAVFAPAAAAKLLKSLRLGENVTVERTPISKIKSAITLAERALGEGQSLIYNFQRLNSERERRFGKAKI